MKVVAFNGSPRGRGSNTGMIVDALFRGMNRAGAETGQVYLSECKIQHCIGCFACWFKTPGVCVHKDDMARLIGLLDDADLVIYATPLYVDNVTGIMKDFMDRCVSRALPQFVTDEQGELRHPRRNGKTGGRMMVVSCCGFVEHSHFQALDHLFRRASRNMSMNIVGTIYRTTGELIKGHVAEVKPLADRYFEQVEQAGEEIVRNGSIPEALQAQIDAPLVPGDLYIKAHNQFCRQMEESLG